MLTNPKKLSHILEGVDVKASSGNIEVEITGISMDSRKVKAGDIYACVPGANVDGHDFAPQAIGSGAVALIVERILPIDIPQVQVENIRQKLGIFAANVYDHPSQSLEIVGVTGTNGKTTVTHLVEVIATKAGKKVGLIGTLGAKIAGREIPGDRTTPEAIEIQALLNEMLAEGVSLVAMEVSSHALDLGRVSGCEFDAGIFTNLTQDHLDYHKTMGEYLKAKSRLFTELKGKKQAKNSILNGDDPAFSELKQFSTAPVASYGIHADNLDYRASNIDITSDRITYTVSFKGKMCEIKYRTPGIFSVYNSLAAFAWGIERGYDQETVAQALAEVEGVPGRFESVRAGQPFQVIVDYAHTPDGLENVLKTAKEFTAGRLITVFGCGGDRDRTKRPLMGKVASELSDYVVVTSDNPRTEQPEKIIEDILPGVKDVEHAAITDRRDGIIKACSMAKPGDTVLIAGKGHETYQIIGKQVFPFDDREVASEALRRLGYNAK